MLPFLDIRALVEWAGLIGVTFIVFAESGLFFGFFLPGDSLLFTAGFLASQGLFNIWALSILCAIAAIVGDSVGYAFGARVGPQMFKREDSIWFHKRNLERAHAFYEKHGGKAIILARFLPVVRTFAPIVAGMAQMTYSRFLAYNIVGGLLWAVGLTWAGYLFGNVFRDDVDRYLIPIVLAIVVLSVLPSVIHVWRESGDEIMAWARERLSRRGGSGGSEPGQPGRPVAGPRTRPESGQVPGAKG